MDKEYQIGDIVFFKIADLVYPSILLEKDADSEGRWLLRVFSKVRGNSPPDQNMWANEKEFSNDPNISSDDDSAAIDTSGAEDDELDKN